MTAKLNQIDLMALRTLSLVHTHGSFSRAAETLGVTQPTVSYTISRLRQTFGDPLFVRQGAGIVPTERCSDIVEQADDLLDRFEALVAPREFDPAHATADITISCNYYERVVILPSVLRALRRDAPGIRMKIIPSTAQGKHQLIRSESDMLIGPIQVQDASAYRRSLMRETYACVMDPANPLGAATMTRDAYLAAPQIVINYGINYRSRFLVALDAEGQRLNNVMEIPSPANLPDLIRGTDMIATVPRRIAALFGGELRSVPCPVPTEFPIDLYWTARTHASGPHIWLREQIATAAAGLVQAGK